MDHVLRICGVLAVALLSGCAPKSDVQVERVTDLGRRYGVTGVTVLPPTGPDWWAVTKPGANLMYFFKGNPTAQPANTAYILVQVRTLEGRHFATAREMLEWIRGHERRMEPGIRMVSDDYTVESAAPPWRVRFRQVQEDTRVPGHEGKPFTCDVHGYHVRHPTWPDYTVTLGYSRRAPSGQPLLPIEREAQVTLASVQFTDERPTIGPVPPGRRPAAAPE